MRIAANGTSLHVRERGGDGPALVLLHYFGGSSRSWDAVIDRLAGEYRCVAPDLRGFGDSAAPVGATASYAVDEYADDVAGLIGALRIERYVLVGHSMGGKIALALAARRPAGLASLVLLAPSPPTPEPIAGAERARLLAGHGDRAAAEETAGAITARPLGAPVFALVVEDNLRTSPQAWRAWLERGSREDISALMSTIAVPVLVVSGTADPVIPADLLKREVVRRIAGARLVMLPDVGHLVPLEAPEATARAIRGGSAWVPWPPATNGPDNLPAP